MKIRNLVIFPTTTKGICIATGILLVLFLLIGVWQTYPFLDDVTAVNSAGDDWLSYKLNALSIIHDGFLIPVVQKSYYEPTGFLYNYFVAAVFALTGENTTHVYLIQAAMLALSVGMLTLVFKPYLSLNARAIYFWTLALILFLDVFRNYTFKLLSENLILLLLPVFYLTLFRLHHWSHPILLSACAGLVLGMCALTRPNLVLMAPVTALLIYLRPPQQSSRAKCIFLFLILFGFIFLLLPLRNYLVTGQIDIPVLTRTHHWQTPITPAATDTAPTEFGKQALDVVIFYARRILFCGGFTFLEAPSYRLRPHWLIMWIGAGIYIWRMLKKKRLEFWELFTLIFVLVYLIPIIALSHLANYGFRMVVPVLPLALLLAVQALSPASESSKNELAAEE